MKILLFIFFSFFNLFGQAKIFVPMDLTQTDHLKAYGVAFRALDQGLKVDWLLNYKSGSFMIDYADKLTLEMRLEGVSFSLLDQADVIQIYSTVQSEENNMEVIRLEKSPKIAVYVPPGFQPWDDAVTLVLDYAKIPYDKIWNEEILLGNLSKYDWLHLHHEDFTGQYGKFYASFSNAQWYIEQQIRYETNAKKLNFRKVSEMKREVAVRIKEFVGQGGFYLRCVRLLIHTT